MLLACLKGWRSKSGGNFTCVPSSAVSGQRAWVVEECVLACSIVVVAGGVLLLLYWVVHCTCIKWVY